MPEFYARLYDGAEKPLSHVLTATLKTELSVPADSLSVTVPLDADLARSAGELVVREGGRTLFEGRVDEVLCVKNRGAAVLKLSARSAAAGLLDCEAEPVLYHNPSSELIFGRHLKPFGITSYTGGSRTMRGTLRIDKGMSHWQVFENFCRNNYGKMPRINGKTACLNGYSADGTAVFGSGGIPCFELKESRSPRREVSAVRVRLADNGGYSSTLENTSCAGNVKRERFVNGLSDSTSLDTASRIIKESNRRSYTVTLNCPGCQTALLGQAAVINDPDLGQISGMRVSGVRYFLNSRGEHSVITLERENF